MNKILKFLVFSAVLLINLGLHKSHQQSLEEIENISASNEWTPSGSAFRDSIVAKLIALSEEPIKLAKQLIEVTIADKQDNEDVIRFLTKSLKEIENSKPDKPAKRTTTFLGLSFIFDVVSVPSMDYEEKRDIVLPIKEAFEKHDVKSVADKFKQKFDEFLEWLTEEYSAKSDKLTLEEQLRIKAFKDMCLEFKNETNFGKKTLAIDALIGRVRDFIVEE